MEKEYCSVSLRDVSRFIKLWIWFRRSLKHRPAPLFNLDVLDDEDDEDDLDGNREWGY